MIETVSVGGHVERQAHYFLTGISSTILEWNLEVRSHENAHNS